MRSFMCEIDDARETPLDQLAVDYFSLRSGRPSIDFCCRAYGVPEEDEAVARRLNVAVSTVRGWREIGRRTGGRVCQ